MNFSKELKDLGFKLISDSYGYDPPYITYFWYWDYKSLNKLCIRAIDCEGTLSDDLELDTPDGIVCFEKLEDFWDQIDLEIQKIENSANKEQK